jgi:CBS domain containing-hemolysin-like protein
LRSSSGQGKPGASSLRHAVEHLDAYLAACQLGITISSIGLGVIGKPAFERLFEPLFGPLGAAAYALSFGFAFAVITLLHVVLGELAPKSLAIARNTARRSGSRRRCGSSTSARSRSSTSSTGSGTSY